MTQRYGKRAGSDKYFNERPFSFSERHDGRWGFFLCIIFNKPKNNETEKV
jgi:hypothetical protein